MDTNLNEYHEWRQSAQALRRQVAVRLGCPESHDDPSTLAEDGARAGLLSWNSCKSRFSDFRNAVAVVEELVTLDAVLGFLGTNQYLCSRAIAQVADAEIRARMEGWLSRQSSPLAVQWLARGSEQDSAALAFRGPLEPAFVFGGMWGQGKDRRPALLVLQSRAGHGQENHAVPLALDRLRFDRGDLNALVRSGKLMVDERMAWFCSSEQVQQLQKIIAAERSILFSIMLTSVAQQAYEYAMEYARQRRSFGKPICQHQAVMLHLADMAIANESARLMIEEALGSDPQSQPGAARRTWTYCREAAISTTLAAAQLLGGHGYLELHPVEKWLRDVECLRILHTTPEDTCSLN